MERPSEGIGEHEAAVKVPSGQPRLASMKGQSGAGTAGRSPRCAGNPVLSALAARLRDNDEKPKPMIAAVMSRLVVLAYGPVRRCEVALPACCEARCRPIALSGWISADIYGDGRKLHEQKIHAR